MVGGITPWAQLFKSIVSLTKSLVKDLLRLILTKSIVAVFLLKNYIELLQCKSATALKEINSQTDQYLVKLQNEQVLVSLTTFFCEISRQNMSDSLHTTHVKI